MTVCIYRAAYYARRY